jgi:hypothetical protein
MSTNALVTTSLVERTLRFTAFVAIVLALAIGAWNTTSGGSAPLE